jgi:uncharacterized protein
MVLRALGLALGLLTPAVLSLPAAAQTLPAPLSDGVSDFAGVLDATEEARVGRLLQETRDTTRVQIVVVTMADLADHGGAGMRLDSYAKALFNAWGVGGAERNDGIMLLVVTGAREARIALGAGYDAVYDGRAARVLSTAVLPEVREGRIAGGIEAGVVSARERLIAPFLEGRPVTVTDGFSEPGSQGDLGWLVGLGGVAGIAGFGFWRMRSRRLCPNCGKDTLNRTIEVIEPATTSSSGTGMQHLTCTSCGFNDRKSYAIPPTRGFSSSRERSSGSVFGASRGSSGRSGRSSGFGGGRSSGGGASGKW